MKDKIITIMVFGIMLILFFIIVGDFYISTKENRPIDDDIIHLLQIAITGLIGIVGVHFGSKNKNDNNEDK